MLMTRSTRDPRDTDAATVEVMYGAETDVIPPGQTVAEVRRFLKHILNVPVEAVAHVNGRRVSGQYLLKDEDTLEFIVDHGEKGGLWEEESRLQHISPDRLARFRRTNPQDCCRTSSGKWLYREPGVYAECGSPPQETVANEMMRLSRFLLGEVVDEEGLHPKTCKLEPAMRKAYFAFLIAEEKAGQKLQDRDAYNFINEMKLADSWQSIEELNGYRLPMSFDTWARQIREARKTLGENKHVKRSGRKGGSIVSENDA